MLDELCLSWKDVSFFPYFLQIFWNYVLKSIFLSHVICPLSLNYSALRECWGQFSYTRGQQRNRNWLLKIHQFAFEESDSYIFLEYIPYWPNLEKCDVIVKFRNKQSHLFSCFNVERNGFPIPQELSYSQSSINGNNMNRQFSFRESSHCIINIQQ